ncbi:alpha/beta hydrolase family protein [Phenylobacterium sp.]|jgi:dipeptidyl aminopeptidase/acylaminoacyl peptidase|uniref:alpha/beta hydrolase family protein n=1 Tax=Phenylobacterium sp. TaxID=1871053 RepID=UPI002F955508
MKVLCAAVLIAAAATYASAQAPPASAFGRLPGVEMAAISPNSQNFAILGGTPQERTISFATLDRPELKTLRLGPIDTVGLRWAGDEHVLARIARWQSYGPRTAYRLERNLAITPEARVASGLLEQDAASGYMVSQPVLGITDEPEPKAMVLGLRLSGGPAGGMDTRLKRQGSESDFVMSLWKVDPKTGRGQIVERGSFDTSSWEVDNKGEARVRIDLVEFSHALTIWTRPKGSQRWQQSIKASDYEGLADYHGYSDPEDAIYFSQGDKLMRRPLAGGPDVAVADIKDRESLDLIWDLQRTSLVGLSSGGEKPVIKWLDAELGAAHATLSRAFKDKHVQLASWSKDRSRFVVRVTAPDAPATWHLYDRPRKELSPIGPEYPELDGVAMGKTRWLTYKARDGLEIPAYLTLPPNLAAGAKPPLIVLPHGGPAARDEYDFDFLTQFLATRGYAVLRPQFRGSTGFGRAHWLAGRGEWGGKVQTDLLDGLAAVADVADTSKVCVVGASFGGYSALVAATMHPQAYRCAVSISGISDLAVLASQEGSDYGDVSVAMKALRRDLGNLKQEQLQPLSPYHLAKKAGPPILLLHGEKDVVVDAEQSRMMANALRAAGKPHELVLLPDEDHYLSSSAGRTQVLTAMEGFLGKHLPVR